MLTPGERAPEFTLPDQDNRERSLTSLLGDGPLILYFYPADFTPGCTAEACTLRDLHTEIQHAGLRVVGVSPQEPESHRRFRDKYTLPFTLLSDPTHEMMEKYGAWGEKSLYGKKFMGVLRITYIIDEEGRIAHVFGKVKTDTHSKDVIAAVDAM